MYAKISLVTLLSLFCSGVHAAQTMVVNGEIKSFLSRDVKLLSHSWDVGAFPKDDLVIEPKGHIKFRFPANAHNGQINFVLSAGSGGSQVACLYDIKYGTQTYVQGAVTLTGPRASSEASSVGKRRAACSMRLDDWDYEKSMNVRFLIQRLPT
ncbi:MAG: hypothetical protein ACRER8_21925 [Pseudomonas sp.]|uniref:hypothetical protein n=1 Tax=Pseudomonas sp. TaxID=306 RepID=UPI003D6F2D3D